MVVDESELLGKGCIVHDKIDHDKELNKETNVISLNDDLDVSSSRHGTTDSSSLFSSDASIEDPPKEEEEEEEEEENKFVADFKGITNDTAPPKDTTEMMEGEANYNTVIPKGIPITNESPPPIERNDGSHESSLLNVHPETSSLETKKPSLGKNLSQEKILEIKKPQKDKMECGGKTNSPNATVKQSNALHRSTESDSSSYSFAFPILVPIEPQHASRKTDANRLQGRSSFSRDEPYLEGDNSISRPQPPSRKKRLCCFCCCFPCQTSSPKCFFC